MRRNDYIRVFQDLVGSSRYWPTKVREAICRSHHVNNRERFIITVFLFHNGVNPEIIIDFFKDCFRLDDAAHRQVRWLIDELFKNPHRYRAYVPSLGMWSDNPNYRLNPNSEGFRLNRAGFYQASRRAPR